MRSPIPFEDLTVRAHHLFDKQWFLLTSGDFTKGHFNTMTISWGSLGIIWNKPFAQVVVRPSRFTYQFMETYDSFTLCAFPESRREALQIAGKKSGRDGNKIQEAGLTPVAAVCVAAPIFAEAELAIECRKMYWQDLDPSHFLDAAIGKNYTQGDYHRVYFGEVLMVAGEEDLTRRR